MLSPQSSFCVCLIRAIVICVLSLGIEMAYAQDKPIVIAHRGACGYVPEHTLEAASMAHAMQVDFIEQDVVLSKDNIPVVLHDIHLDTVTDVAQKFPGRARSDGRFYAIDFALDEIKQLFVHERISLKTGKAVFPNRFDASKALFRVPTLEEEIELIKGLNAATGRDIGIYVEIKKPAWHREQDKDTSKIVLETLAKHGYQTKQDNVYLQCFDPKETRRIREKLKCNLKLVQLIADNEWNEANTDFDKMRTQSGIAQIAQYADGIGPWMPHILKPVDGGEPQATELVQLAHEKGLVVHPFTFRQDSLPKYAKSFDGLMKKFLAQRIDGLFTDFPDLSCLSRNEFLAQTQKSSSQTLPGSNNQNPALSVEQNSTGQLEGSWTFSYAPNTSVIHNKYIGALFSPERESKLKIDSHNRMEFADAEGKTSLELGGNSLTLVLSDGSDGRRTGDDYQLCWLIEHQNSTFNPTPGRCWSGKYKLDGDLLTFRFPHTCRCSRTGITFSYKRDTK